MKHGFVFGLAVFALMVGVGGCQQQSIRDGKRHDYGAPADSLDGYAKSHGISREEAAKRMRAELVPPGDAAGTPSRGNETLK
jgi:hypothetical protein